MAWTPYQELAINEYGKNIIVSVSSHNFTSERQFRNPVEYGAPRPSSATFTTTGGASILITNTKTYAINLL